MITISEVYGTVEGRNPVNVKVFTSILKAKNGDMCTAINVIDFTNIICMSFLEMAKESIDEERAYYESITRAAYLMERNGYRTSEFIVYTHSKIVENQINGTWGRKKNRKPYAKLKKYLDRGLKVKYIDPDFNCAVMVPWVWKHLNPYEDYNRTCVFQKNWVKQFVKNGGDQVTGNAPLFDDES